MTPADLLTARNKLGLSQAGLARLLNVPVNTIARWERGDMAIQHPTILRLALERLADTQTPHTTKAAPA